MASRADRTDPSPPPSMTDPGPPRALRVIEGGEPIGVGAELVENVLQGLTGRVPPYQPVRGVPDTTELELDDRDALSYQGGHALVAARRTPAREESIIVRRTPVQLADDSWIMARL
jgi:hypothetical protein